MNHAAKRSIIAPVAIADFYATVIDYLAYPHITDEVKSARILARDGHVATVAFTAKVMLKGFDYTVRMVEDPANHGMSWSLIASNTLTVNEGAWALEALSDNETRVTYENALGTRLWIPSSFLNGLTGMVLPKMLRRFSEHAEARAGRRGERVA